MLEAAIGTAMMIRSMELAVPALPLQFPAVKPQPVAENEIKLLTGD
jgi:hypothetical protein